MAFVLGRKLETAFKGIKSNLSNKETSPWIKDNFYIIRRFYISARKDKRNFKYVALYNRLEEFCYRSDYDIRVPELVKHLRETKEKFSYGQLSALPQLLGLCAINGIYYSAKAKEEEMIGNCVKLLISLSDPDYNTILPSLWEGEEVLREREPQYEAFSEETKGQYRFLVAQYAEKRNITELSAITELFAEAEAKNIPIGTLLFAPKRVYSVLWLGLTLFLSALLVWFAFLTTGLIALLLTAPLIAASVSLADIFLSAIAPVYKPPRMELSKIPDEGKTLVTIAALLNGGKSDKAVFESLERFYFMNRDENIYFCLLADLPDSTMQFRLEDGEILNNAYRKIDELNNLYGNRFCIFLRERVLNKSEGNYGGWERKRGAVCELVSHIIKGDKSEYYGGEFIRDIKYLLTLDSDTNLSVGSVKELISIALHPVNQPHTEDGAVVRGYGIIQPSIRTELSSAYRSGFSRLITGLGGTDIYANAFFQRSQNLFGSGSFCGKGLINAELFYRLVCPAIPEGIVLSHDAVEGALMSTLSASDITLTDSTPGNAVSFFKREHRWLRGDFQNLWFLKGKKLRGFSKIRLFATVCRHTVPLFAFVSIVAGAFMAETRGLVLFILAFSHLLLPWEVSMIRGLFSGKPFAVVHFFSHAYTLFAQGFFRLLFEITATARKAALVAHAYFLSAVRLITRRKTLQWTTAAQAEKNSSSLGKYVIDGWFSVLSGLALLIFAIPPFVKLAGLLFFVYPLVSAVLARPLDSGAEVRPELDEEQRKLLYAHASDMFRFYYENVDEETNHLPPDNIQLSPVNSVALRTSPTNIGFYLVSLLGAYDLEMIDRESFIKRLNLCLDSVEKLKKYRGNLYNWYDIAHLTPLNSYVSTVDSGNFVVMLLTLKVGLYNLAGEDSRFTLLAERCEKLINNTDITPLYDRAKNLFYIGINATDGTHDKSHYDLLMSECRLLSYYAVASSVVPKKHWQALGRTVTHKGGYMGMMSWSGTAFEYFMPQLFMPLYKNSFIYESVAFSLMVQRRENRLWGVSESGYYAFDSDMNYQYKANGLQTLALRRIADDERIISPYSTYLSLCVSSGKAMKNLENLEKRGMYGKYGFYEALDLNNKSGIAVKSYMAHHVGMSIIATVNALKNNIFVKRFMQDKTMLSAGELLQEKIPLDACVFGDREREAVSAQKKNSSRKSTHTPDMQQPKTALLSRGNLSLQISDIGHIGMKYGTRLLANTVFDITSLRFTPGVVFSRGGRHFGCAPLYRTSENYGFQQGDGFVSHISSGRDFSGCVRYSMAQNSECIIISTRAENLKKYDITLSMEPVLRDEKGYRSHISFSRLFIESEYDAKKKILYFHRRSASDGRHIFTLAVGAGNRDMQISFLADGSEIPSGEVMSPATLAGISTNNIDGACVSPLCLFRANDADGGRATFIITCGESKQVCENNIRLSRGEREDYPCKAGEDMQCKMLSNLLYNKSISAVERFSNCYIDNLWSKGISGDYPIALIFTDRVALNRTKEIINSFSSLKEGFVNCELVFIVSDEDLYSRPVERSVYNVCKKLGCAKYLGKNKGIFILRKDELTEDLINALVNRAEFCLHSNGCEYERAKEVKLFETITSPETILPKVLPKGATESSHGYFHDRCFTVDKSRKLSSPYSYILTGHRFSTVLTHNSLGYTFFDNSRERRLCSFCGDVATLDDGERIFALSNRKKYDLCAMSHSVVYGKGRAEYYGTVEGNGYHLTVTVHPKFPVKLIKVEYDKEIYETRFSLRPVMGDSILPQKGIEVLEFSTSDSACLMFRNPLGITYPEGHGFAGVAKGSALREDCTLMGNSREVLFFIGSAATYGGAVKTASKVNFNFFKSCIEEAEIFASDMVPSVVVSTNQPETDAILNCFVPYQVAACRFYARGSFYQSGGAYGFRDQLQDCLTLIYSQPKKVRQHLIRCCAHQYDDGSVMHWWHTRHYGRVNRGIKSKCSDDMLYLPLVVADYIEKTDDETLLRTEVNYITSPPLGAKSERYEEPRLTEIKGTVYDHCIKALEYGFKMGKNKLLLMGSCDWNDAFSKVGERGEGESIFTTMLYVAVAKAFLPVARLMKDLQTEEMLTDRINLLVTALEENAFFGDRYARAICDDGTVLGVEGCRECEIDILSQAFSAIIGMDKERSKQALKRAFRELYDGDNLVFKLFSPPFDKGTSPVGYIRGYVAGIRENGGQYTHGALWGALGCIKAGMNDEALKILNCANPAFRCQNQSLAKQYRNEPYVLSADVYGGNYIGRGGWSWYTGAAAWFYRIMLEYVLGLKFGRGKLLSANPIIPFNAYVTLNKGSHDAFLNISASDKYKELTINGEKAQFPFEFISGKYNIEIPLK